MGKINEFVSNNGWWMLSIIFSALIGLALFSTIGYDLIEEYNFIEKYGVTRDELECKDFCNHEPYYFDEGGLFSSDSCVCKYSGGIETW